MRVLRDYVVIGAVVVIIRFPHAAVQKMLLTEAAQ